MLSEPEQAVLQGLARGQSGKAIAAALSVSADTVNRHVKHTYAKLRARHRAATGRSSDGAAASGRGQTAPRPYA